MTLAAGLVLLAAEVVLAALEVLAEAALVAVEPVEAGNSYRTKILKPSVGNATTEGFL